MSSDRFCRRCGNTPLQLRLPRGEQYCSRCGFIVWRNPTPIAVLVHGVRDSSSGSCGVLLGHRSSGEQSGRWGLPGGFMELDETVEEGAARELLEETGIVVDARRLELWRSSAPPGQVLIFCHSPNHYLTTSSLLSFAASEECDEVRVAWAPEELAFPAHTWALERWFAVYGE